MRPNEPGAKQATTNDSSSGGHNSPASPGSGRHTLYQVSTANALVEGVYQGAVQVATLREHGDLGLGTFGGLDGEMVILNGQFFQARCDGSVREVEDNAVTPFAAVTPFSPDISVMMGSCLGMQCVTAVFDELRKSDNIFFALRVDGKFESVRARAMCRSDEGVRLVQAAAVQPEFEFCDIAGTLVGFWSPEYASAFNVPGYHFHFISADRTCGGHVLECRGRDLRLQIQREGEYHVALPETEAFLRADLTRDPKADIKRAEGAK